MAADQVFGVGLIALGLALFVLVARYERPMLFGFGLVETLLKRLPPWGQRAYVFGLGVVMIVLGVVALSE